MGKKQNEVELRRLFEEIMTFIRKGVLGTTKAYTFSLNEIGAAIKQEETPGRHGKVEEGKRICYQSSILFLRTIISKEGNQ
ncbi:hypothetical protein [Ktedonospora formicarum]|uniref:Uncharacterized protein n=1 Tax=Ktedonospora formicarum TaxID=2778364 RepID=A0A8J3MUI5_9CHLR|nr:hypothetical protein [Ktedonospora formicarum]GHO49392.1 hypothetical protein KSX_75550 [Ktedonospora formicarum]